MTGPPETPSPAGNEASGAQVSNQAGRQVGQANTPNETAAQARDFLVNDGRRIVGAVIGCTDGYAAHGRRGKLGVFATSNLALTAVRSADLAAFLENQSTKAKALADLRKGNWT
jgi:hypothetical protein